MRSGVLRALCLLLILIAAISFRGAPPADGHGHASISTASEAIFDAVAGSAEDLTGDIADHAHGFDTPLAALASPADVAPRLQMSERALRPPVFALAQVWLKTPTPPPRP